MLEKFKDYDYVAIRWETFEEKDFIVDYLKKNGFKTDKITFTLGETISLINQNDKTFTMASNIELKSECEKNVVFIQSKEIITLEMKKQMYLTKEQLRCIEYVKEVLTIFEITDLYVDDFGLMVKARNIYSLEDIEEEFANFFETCIAKEIEEEFCDRVYHDWYDLDEQYEILKLSRKCVRELK